MVNEVILGDCREILPLISANSISACITDPPYNYEFIGHKWDHDEIQRRITRIESSSTLVKNIPYGSGLAGGVRNARWYERNRTNTIEYQTWCREWAREVLRVCKPGAIVAAFSSSRTAAHLQVALEDVGFYARDCLVYRRPSGIPKGLNAERKLRKLGHQDAAERWRGWHSCLRNEWEAIVVVQKPLEGNYIDTLLKYDVGLFRTHNNDGSFQSNILEDFANGDSDRFDVHCTVKPLALMEKLIAIFVPPSGDHVVLDPFAGTGTTLVAAKNLGRRYLGIEIVPEYIPIIERRLEGEASQELSEGAEGPRFNPVRLFS